MKYGYFFLLGVFVFLLDLATPVGYYDWFLFWILIAWTSRYFNKQQIYALGAFYSLLVLSSLIFIYSGSQPDIFNHIFGIVVLLFLTYWLVQFRERERNTKDLINNLKKKQEELNNIYNRIDEIVFALDKNWVGVYKNAAADRRGYQFINVGDNFFEKMPRLVGTPLYLYMKKALETQEKVTFLQETMYSTKPQVLSFTIYPSDDGVLVFTKDLTEVIQAHREAQKATDTLYHLIDRIEDALWALDKNYIVVYGNDKFIKWTGQKKEDIIGHQFYEALPILKGSVVENKFNEAMETQQVLKFEMESLHVPGMFVNLSVHPSEDGLTIFAQDFTEYKNTRIKLQHALEEKDYLLQEVHHRIKNNLQIISSIINIESTRIDDEKIKSVISDIANRIQSISFLHSKIYDINAVDKIDASFYIKEITEYLSSSYQRQDVILDLKIDEVLLDTSRATAVGIIVNELVSNCFKYAFHDNSHCTINIHFYKQNGDAKLIVSDNGSGYPIKSLTGESSLGLELVKHLTEQLEGTIIIENRGGAYNTIIFPLQTQQPNDIQKGPKVF